MLWMPIPLHVLRAENGIFTWPESHELPSSPEHHIMCDNDITHILSWVCEVWKQQLFKAEDSFLWPHAVELFLLGTVPLLTLTIRFPKIETNQPHLLVFANQLHLLVFRLMPVTVKILKTNVWRHLVNVMQMFSAVPGEVTVDVSQDLHEVRVDRREANTGSLSHVDGALLRQVHVVEVDELKLGLLLWPEWIQQ